MNRVIQNLPFFVLRTVWASGFRYTESMMGIPVIYLVLLDWNFELGGG